MKVALVYDRVNKWGGAERVLLALHKIFPDAPLYTAVYNPETAPWANVFPQVYTSFLQNLPFASSHHEQLAPLMPVAFESFSFDTYDLVISVTSEAAKGIVTKPATKHICLCLTPTRYLWSGYHEYFTNPLMKLISWPVVRYLRMWDRIAAKRPDTYIAISQEVQDRIKKYYGRESTVVYPAVTLEPETGKQITKNGEYFLVVARLSKFTKYKRVDIAIKAANALKIPLKIVGDGNIDYFKQFAGSTVEFVGKVTDEQLRGYYAGCKAVIFPSHEDFGLVVVEAQLYGKPVIAFRAGGALETIIEGKTGEFFSPQTPGALINILKNFDEKRYNTNYCKENAQRFSFREFENAIKKLL